MGGKGRSSEPSERAPGGAGSRARPVLIPARVALGLDGAPFQSRAIVSGAPSWCRCRPAPVRGARPCRGACLVSGVPVAGTLSGPGCQERAPPAGPGADQSGIPLAVIEPGTVSVPLSCGPDAGSVPAPVTSSTSQILGAEGAMVGRRSALRPHAESHHTEGSTTTIVGVKSCRKVAIDTHRTASPHEQLQTAARRRPSARIG